ncbi:MAG: hypothetical protein LC733_01760 [Actinobacteria bacterium]|nr:hypothetical protein [Actinomycetota bacterium]
MGSREGVGGGVVVGVVSTVVEVVEVEVVNAVVEVVSTVLVVVEVDVRLALPPATPAEASGMPPASKTTVTPTFAAAKARFATAICPIGRAGRAGSSRPHVDIGHMSRRLEQKYGFFAKSGEARTLTGKWLS